MIRRYGRLALLLCTAGCLWRGYATIMSVHLDVLTQTADKLCAVIEAGRGLRTEDMAEYTYPAQRAREFLAQFKSNSGQRSYQQLGVLLDRYEALVHTVDAIRAQGAPAHYDVPHLRAECDALHQLATEIRTDLRSE